MNLVLEEKIGLFFLLDNIIFLKFWQNNTIEEASVLVKLSSQMEHTHVECQDHHIPPLLLISLGTAVPGYSFLV